MSGRQKIIEQSRSGRRYCDAARYDERIERAAFERRRLISFPREVDTGPPYSETSVTSYAAEPSFQFAVSNTLVAAKFIGEKAG
jgi:hypothetical protein